jgi:hypothetical protein
MMCNDLLNLECIGKLLSTQQIAQKSLLLVTWWGLSQVSRK